MIFLEGSLDSKLIQPKELETLLTCELKLLGWLFELYSCVLEDSRSNVKHELSRHR
jgi:hypothetical protein